MSKMRRIVIVTCETWPDLFASDQALRAALEARGVGVVVKPWQAADFWSVAETCEAIVVRAAWDYPLDPVRFEAWLSQAEQSRVPVLNSPALMRWNSDKRYVFDLARAGVRMPRTALVEDARDLEKAFAEVGAETAIIKPCHGASGRGIEKVTRDTAAAYVAQHGGAGRSFLLQEMLPEITAGELSFVFIEGEFSHVVRKTPAEGEFRVNSAYGPARNEAVAVDQRLVAQATDILSRLPLAPVYARIDCVERAGALICLEAEVIEPSLFLHMHPPGAERFAAAVVERID